MRKRPSQMWAVRLIRVVVTPPGPARAPCVPPEGQNRTCVRMWSRLGWQRMIKYNCKEQSQMLQRFKTKKSCVFLKQGKNRSCEEKGEFCKKGKVLKAGATPFRAGWFLHAHAEQIERAGVQGHNCHTRMIDGSVWMLKSTEPEHVPAARRRPATQHLFKGQVLPNTLPPLSDQPERGNHLWRTQQRNTKYSIFTFCLSLLKLKNLRFCLKSTAVFS